MHQDEAGSSAVAVSFAAALFNTGLLAQLIPREMTGLSCETLGSGRVCPKEREAL